MRCVVFTGVGGGEVVDLQERPDPVPGSGELIVRVRYAGLNPADLQQRAGRYPAPPGAPQDIPGLEVAGVVESVGSQVLAHQPGDRVFGLIAGGGLADRVAVHERCVARVPDSLSDIDAAATPEAFITAHDAIRTRGRLTMGETLLVHGANGGVGTAALQIGVAAGAQVFGVVRSDEAGALVRELGAEPVADDDFSEHVRADVILELVGAPHFPANLTALNPRGRIVVVGVGAGSKVELDLGAMMGRRASCTAPCCAPGRSRTRRWRCARSSARSCRTWRRAGSGRSSTASTTPRRPATPTTAWPAPASPARCWSTSGRS